MEGYKKVESTRKHKARKMTLTISHHIIVCGRAVSNKFKSMGFNYVSLYYNTDSIAIRGEKSEGIAIKSQMVFKYKEVIENLEKTGIGYDDKVTVEGEWINENTIVFKLKEG